MSVADAKSVAEQAPSDRSAREWRRILTELWRTGRGRVGMILLTVFAIYAAAGFLAYDNPPPAGETVEDRFRAPSPDQLLGTDNLGRSVWEQLAVGAGISLAVGVAAMALSLTVGTVIGVLSGFFRRLDGLLMRFTDLFLALPVLPLLMVATMLFREPLRAALGLEAGIFVLVVGVIGITSWMQTARIVRGQVLAIRAREYVTAARSVGARPWRIISRHVFPNALSPIVVAATLDIAAAIITESALSFLGLGFPSDFPTWGRLLYDGVPFLTLTPDRVIWPGLAISLTVLSVNFLGDGLRDALDPHATAASRGSRRLQRRK